ncbi:MAG: RHS repeat protein, partial [Clostridia bacterium]|nr:RHS repeat protein [Clostridia bacterium]
MTEYNYYADGRLKSTTKPDGSVSTNTYDDEGNLLTLVTLDAAEDVLDSFTYVYDDNSIGYKNQISKTEIVAGVNKGTTSYEYDIQGRLTKVTNPDGSTN